jgi:SAM-dependent methyltransferase
MWLRACTVFLSAFLLFQIQPMVAKWMLPSVGGSAAVWTTCMLFFQMVLLLGYLYSDWSVRKLARKAQFALHIVLLLLSVPLLLMRPTAIGDLAGGSNPVPGILALLARSIGVPYFLLATTTPLIQAWYARGNEKALPYRLFALSNLASILALLGYPVVIEPWLSLGRQFRVWSWAYLLFVVFCLVSALQSFRAAGERTAPGSDDLAGPAREPDWNLKLIWMWLAACACILFLAVTNYLTQNIAPVPFLWVLPLGVYLLTFVLCFNDDRWANTNVWRWLVGPTLAALGLVLLKNRIGGLILTVSLFAATLFVCCMFCHSELARRKPQGRFLTSFYLMVSVGGALGGVFVVLIAPLVFTGYFELPAGMAFCAILALHLLRRTASPMHLVRLALVALAGFLVCMRVFLLASGTHLMTRNFYGSLRIEDKQVPGPRGPIRLLFHGSIIHGVQFLSPQYRRQPTAYYGPESGVGLAMECARKNCERVGVIGLGAGVLAAYGRKGDYYRFYEINPLVARVAGTEFSFLRDSQARVDVVRADARVALEREPGQHFDILVLDAFSGDSIPVHLLTKEAFATYFRHLKPDGVLAAHVSNQYLDIRSVVERLGLLFDKRTIAIESPGDSESRTLEALWVLVTSDRSVLENPRLKAASAPPAFRPGAQTWTDDYSNLFQVLK